MSHGLQNPSALLEGCDVSIEVFQYLHAGEHRRDAITEGQFLGAGREQWPLLARARQAQHVATQVGSDRRTGAQLGQQVDRVPRATPDVDRSSRSQTRTERIGNDRPPTAVPPVLAGMAIHDIEVLGIWLSRVARCGRLVGWKEILVPGRTGQLVGIWRVPVDGLATCVKSVGFQIAAEFRGRQELDARSFSDAKNSSRQMFLQNRQVELPGRFDVDLLDHKDTTGRKT